MTAFATPADLVNRYDARTLGDLASDNGVRVPEALLTTSDKLTTALSSASGEIKAAVLRGERYTTAELEALTGESADYLKHLTCRIAFWNLWQRKPYSEDQQRSEAKKSSDEALELLSSGARVFDVQRALDAGTPKVATVTRTEINDNYELFVDRARGHVYPARRTYARR